MGDYLADIQSQNAAGANPPIAGQFVVYDLPDRDCAALASNGEYSIADNGVEHYKDYIDSIRQLLVEYSDIQTILVIGERSLRSTVPVQAETNNIRQSLTV
jgi:cellulose 1,4-beta-cellobiosidase